MPDYRYLIIGGGMTADAAAHGIRERDATGSIGIIGAEPDPPYSRPPLSKALWKDEPIESVWRPTAETRADLHLGRRVTSIDARGKQVTDDRGTDYAFDKLLLATGGTPRRLPFGGDDVVYFRTLADYQALRALSDAGKSFIVIGGGFIGSEIAAALAMRGNKVTMLFPENGIGARIFPADLSEFLAQYYRDKGVDVRSGENVADIRSKGAQRVVALKDGGDVTADAVVAGIGITPNIDLAQAAGLATDNGVVVDAQLRTTNPDIFAAGDVARLTNRVEHEDNALTMGAAAGRAMAGDTTPYTHIPFFYSDLFDLGFEAVGDLDSRLETSTEWKEPFREGVIHYKSGGKVRGVLLWNTWGKLDEARALIASQL